MQNRAKACAIAKAKKDNHRIFIYVAIVPLLIGLAIVIATRLQASERWDASATSTSNPAKQGWQQLYSNGSPNRSLGLDE